MHVRSAPNLIARFWGALGAGTLPADRHFEAQRRVDPFGYRVHLGCGLLSMLMLGGPTSVAELSLAPVGVAAIVRIHRYWRTLGAMFMQPVTLAWLLATCFGLLGLLWSPDRAHGWDELSLTRWAAQALFLWPVMERRSLLLLALIVGLHIGQVTQAIHAAGVLLDVESLQWNRMPGRWSGWWDPVVGGTLLVGLLGLHLPAAAWGRGGWRISGLIGSAAAIAGLVATGTRGAWLASIGLVGCVLLCWWWCGGRSLKIAGAALALAFVLTASAVGVGVVAGGSGLGHRVESARTEIERAMNAGDFTTDTGARIGMAIWAGQAFTARPVAGVGTGGYQAWVRQHVEGPEGQPVGVHAHAHNGLAHIAATGGVIGAVLCLLVLASAISSAGRFVEGDGPMGYAQGPVFAMLGLALVSAFDPFHLNTQTCALFATLVVLRMPNRPRTLAG